MEKINNFSLPVIKKLNYYVYRLIDPRNGNTFYAGKGKGNRVFAHMADALKITREKIISIRTKMTLL